MQHIERTQDALLREYEEKIKKRPGKIDNFAECVYIFIHYEALKQRGQVKETGNKQNSRKKGATVAPIFYDNATIAEQFYGISKRLYLMKKAVGKDIYRKIYRDLVNYPVLNNLRFLNALAKRKSKCEQEIIFSRVVHYIKSGVPLRQAMTAVGLLPKKPQNADIKVPPGKTPIFVYQELAARAKDTFCSTGLSLEQQTEILLHSEITRRKTGRNAMMHRSHF